MGVRLDDDASMVTVIMPVFNAEPHLDKAIRCVLCQSHRNLELIAVNDGSTDGSLPVLTRYAARDARMKVIDGPNRGAGAARNRAVAEARTKWVFQIDADDFMHPDRIARQLAFLREHPDVNVASCFGYYVNGSGTRVGRITYDLTTRERFSWYLSSNETIGILNQGAVYDRDAFLSIGGYREHIFPAEDIDLWVRFAEAGYTILVQPEFLVDVTIHPSSTVGSNFVATRQKSEWVREMMRARRRGEPEPTWEEFLEYWRAAPLPKRANRWRKIQAKRCFRQAGMELAGGRRLHALGCLASAIALQPLYSLPRLKQRMPSQPMKKIFSSLG